VPDALVTGGTGFVGGAVVRRLITEGRVVRAVARSGPGLELVAGLGAEAVPGNLLDLGSLRRAMDGCRVVFHCAGVNTMCPRDPSPMFRANVEGSVNVVRAAAGAGVAKVVYTSSAAAVGEAQGAVGNEETLHRGCYLSHYERSKHQAELAVLEEASSLGVDVVCLNPASVQGPGRVGGTARILLGYLTGRLRWAVDSTLSLVFVDDCAAAHLLAEERGLPGRRYLVSGATLTVGEAAAALARAAGIERRVRFLPGWVATVAAVPVWLGSRLARQQPPLCPEMARVLRHGAAYDGSRAERELSLSYTPLEDWLRVTVEWYRAQGLVG
jgi:dihydroflavonol-4-reductase